MSEVNAQELLSKEGLYPLLDYAWEDYDQYSSEFAGLAMFLSDPPYKPDFSWDGEDQSAASVASSAEQICYISSEDFIGAMDVALQTVGEAYLRFKRKTDDFVVEDEEPFWLCVANAAIWLNIASDRVRDFFIVSRFGVTTKKYQKFKKENPAQSVERGKYSYPFATPTDGSQNPEPEQSLKDVSKAVHGRRSKRNKIVHEIASRRGANARLHILFQKDAAGNGKNEVMNANIKEAIQKACLDENTQMERELSDLKQWYLDLVKLAHEVFMYDYFKRRQSSVIALEP